MSCFMTGGPDKGHGTNKLPPTRRAQEKSKGDTMCPITSQTPCWHPYWLSNAWATRKDSESECLAKDNPETNPITIKPETASHVAEQFTWVLLPCCCLPGRPFPIDYLAVSARVTLDNSFLSIRQEPTLGALERVPLPTTSPGR